MIWIDYAIAGAVGTASVIGTVKGYNQQTFALLVAFIALMVGLGFSRDLAYFLPPSIKDSSAKLATAFVALYALTSVVGAVIRLLLGKLLKSTRPAPLERIGGLGLGILRGGIWATAIIILAGLSVLPHSPWWNQTKLVPPFQTIALWLKEHIPSGLLEKINYR